MRQESTLDVNFELFNIFNAANFANPTVDQRATDFLVLTALRGGNGQPRAAQVGVRFGSLSEVREESENLVVRLDAGRRRGVRRAHRTDS